MRFRRHRIVGRAGARDRRDRREQAAPRRSAMLAVAAVFAVAGCGVNIHPGTAAVVNGHVISQGEVDDLVLAACEYSEAVRLEQGGAEPGQSMAALRSSLAEALIQFEVTDEAARQLGLSVSDASVAKLTADSTMPPGLSDESRELLEGFFSDASRAQLQQAVVGAHLRDPKVVTAEDATPEDIDAATKYLNTFAADQDVTVNPSYGSWDGTTLVHTSGSLSDAVSTTPPADDLAAAPDPVKDLPPSQVCG